MPCISGKYEPNVGPIIQVAIVKPEINKVSASGGQQASVNFYQALIDTGATSTCISPRVASEVGLQPMGKAQMIGSTGVEAKNTYQFGVGFMINPVQQPTGNISGELTLMIVDGMEFSQKGFGFDVLLGRDIICKGSFSLSFDGHYIFSF